MTVLVATKRTFDILTFVSTLQNFYIGILYSLQYLWRTYMFSTECHDLLTAQ